MKTLIVYYSVQSGGDGSAHPQFMESQELAQWDQDHMSDGWGESCDGSISFESESDIFPVDKIQTKEDYLINHYFSKGERQEFIKQFFPNGLPVFKIETEIVKTTDQYLYNNVFVDGKLVARHFTSVAQSGKVFEDKLNNQQFDDMDDEDNKDY